MILHTKSKLIVYFNANVVDYQHAKVRISSGNFRKDFKVNVKSMPLKIQGLQTFPFADQPDWYTRLESCFSGQAIKVYS